MIRGLNGFVSGRTNLDERQLVPHLKERARSRSPLEGRTHVDAVLIDGSTHCAVLFEGKVTSDCSYQVTFDMMRNQLARNIDAMLDPNPQLQPPLNARDPERSAFVLLTRCSATTPTPAFTADSCRSTSQAPGRFTATSHTEPSRRPTGTTICHVESAG